MRPSLVEARRPVAADLAILAPNPRQNETPAYGLPLSPQCEVQLTPKGVAYCLRHGRPAIERRIERHLALVTALLAVIDEADGDPDGEPDLAYTACEANLDAYSAEQAEEDGGDMPELVNEDGGDILDEPHDDVYGDMEPFEPTAFYPNGAHLSGGGSEI